VGGGGRRAAVNSAGKNCSCFESDSDGSFREIEWECVDWIELAQDRDRWRAVLNARMNLQGP
jgi:hypothetical protein